MKTSPKRHHAVRLTATGTVALAILSSSGCTAEQPRNEPRQRISVSQVNRYTDLDQMQRDSSAVVVADAVDSTTATHDRIPITKTSAKIRKVLAGSVPESTVNVEQLGTDKVDSPDTSRLMKSGETYLLYLSKDSGKENGEDFVITGGDGIYVLQGHRYVYRGGPPTGPGRSLPTELPADETEEKVTSQQQQ
ncbi:hypothetical protein OHA57_13015 [Streptomyces anulatus]|uniref:hypothetical protein n=1 Tax=Streptomyces anulatus TaxID=1892 RepID=UPI002DDB7BAF|nr:hypothetical protein [Streptomyces anulatus]WSC61621.1 hypothetical protein OHA57_13015 [Streptomyces anulatus]